MELLQSGELGKLWPDTNSRPLNTTADPFGELAAYNSSASNQLMEDVPRADQCGGIGIVHPVDRIGHMTIIDSFEMGLGSTRHSTRARLPVIPHQNRQLLEVRKSDRHSKPAYD